MIELADPFARFESKDDSKTTALLEFAITRAPP
jgi:hypothetical protein